MLAPASYEELAAPIPDQCLEWGYISEFPLANDDSIPLIHAVGGLDGYDQWIANHRRGAHPRLHATASDAVSKTGSVAITGTSVATAAVAGAHLLMWSFDHSLIGSDVVTELYAWGYPIEVNDGTGIGIMADAGRYEGELIRRLQICPAVAALAGLACQALPPNYDYLDVYTEETNKAIAAADTSGSLLVAPVTLTGTSATCPSMPSPAAGADPLIKPQPERPACSNCNGILKGMPTPEDPHTLNMSIQPQTWRADLQVSSASLHTYVGTGNARTYNLSSIVVNDINTANPTNIIQVPFDTMTAPLPTSAVLEFNYVYSSGANAGKFATKQSNVIPLLYEP